MSVTKTHFSLLRAVSKHKNHFIFLQKKFRTPNICETQNDYALLLNITNVFITN